MPIREYVCADCNKHHDTLVRTTEDIPVKCPHCGSEKITSVITAIGGYAGNFGGGSTSPRGKGSFRRGRK